MLKLLLVHMLSKYPHIHNKSIWTHTQIYGTSKLLAKRSQTLWRVESPQSRVRVNWPRYVIINCGTTIQEHNDSDDGCWDEHLCVDPQPGKIQANLLPKIFPVCEITNSSVEMIFNDNHNCISIYLKTCSIWHFCGWNDADLFQKVSRSGLSYAQQHCSSGGWHQL